MSAEDCTIRWVGQQTVIALPPEIDVINADEVSRALVSAASLGAAVLVIDMSETTFCDSAGVQALIAAHKQAAATGTALRLVAPAVLRILTLVGIDQMIPLYPAVGEALAGTPGGR